MASPKSSPKSSPASSPKDSTTDEEMNLKEEHMFEDIAEIKVKHAEAIATLRSQLTLPCDDDLILYRFLLGHKFVMATAVSKLNDTLAWRKENKLDELRLKAEKVEQRQYPFADKVLAVHPHNIIHGYDKEGQPLSIERLGMSNPYMMTRTVKFEEMLQYHFYHMEAKASIVNALSLKSGKVIRTCKIMDLSGLGRHHLDRRGLAFMKRLIDLSQHNYPEMLGRLYVVNTPWIFSLGWKIVKPWLNPSTLSKIHILSNDEYQTKLKENIDEQYIPVWLGGKCDCGGRGCVPVMDPDAGMTTKQVAARGKYEHTVTIDQTLMDSLKAAIPASASSSSIASSSAAASSSSSSSSSHDASFLGVTLTYEFRTKKNDIGFEIRSAPIGSSSSKVLLASKRYQSDQDTIDGHFLITEPCVITLQWDNSFSWMSGKTLLFRVDTDAASSRSDDDESVISKEMQKLASETQSPDRNGEGEE